MDKIVYALSHPVTDEIRYIGKSERGLYRPREHGMPHNMRRHEKTPIVRWIKKLRDQGLDYKIEIVEEFPTRETLMEGERFYIAYFRSLGIRLLNICDGGEGRTGPLSKASIEKMKKTRRTPQYRDAAIERQKKLWKDPIYIASVHEGHERKSRDPSYVPHWTGRHHSEESRKKISETKRSRPLTDGQRAAVQVMIESNRGRKHPPRSPEWRAKLGYWKGKTGATKGRPKSEEIKVKLSRSQGGTAIRDDLGNVYSTIHDAARKTGIPATRICAVLKGRRKSAGGRMFTRII